MKLDDIRRLNEARLICADFPGDVREIILSPLQVEVLDIIRRRKDSVRSSHLVGWMDMSVQQASMVLSALYRKGYLCRTSQPQESGGYEYEYTWELEGWHED